MNKRLLMKYSQDSHPTIVGPVWENGCEHGDDEYVCSFECADHPTKTVKKFDLYLFQDDLHGVEVCIRYGNKGHEYASPGDVGSFLMSAASWPQNQEYRIAAMILKECGLFDWKPRNH